MGQIYLISERQAWIAGQLILVHNFFGILKAPKVMHFCNLKYYRISYILKKEEPHFEILPFVCAVEK